ncbi:hypothetical protein ACOL22_11930, partial [Aliarcobacter butzleri]
MINALQEQGTLKTENLSLPKIDPEDRGLKTVYQAWINVKTIDERADTMEGYEGCYKDYFSGAIDEMLVADITENP